jgi:hypothetical protein
LTENIQTTILSKKYIKLTQKEADEKLVEQILKYIKQNGLPRNIYVGFGKNMTDNTSAE